jgi:hypothetical protein
MQPNNISELAELIDNTSSIVIALIITTGCDHHKNMFMEQLEKIIKDQPNAIPIHVSTICYSDEMIPFPRPQSPIAYYFAPNNQTPLFYRDQFTLLKDIGNDIRIATEMIEGKSYIDAALDDETKARIAETDNMLKTEDISHYPPFFKQMRDLGSAMWKSTENMITGRPVLVSAEVAFERVSICQTCPFFKEESRCEKCGCFMKTKAQLAVSSCPEGKWGSV